MPKSDKERFYNDTIKKLIIHVFSDAQKIAFTKKELRRYYNNFVDYLIGKKPLLITKYPLDGFYSNLNKIELEKGIIIKRMSLKEREFLYSRYTVFHHGHDSMHIIMNEFFLFNKYYHKKGAINEYAIEIETEFIKFARIFQKGKIDIKFSTMETNKWNPDYAMVGGLFSGPSRLAQGEGDYILNNKNVKEFISLWRKYREINFNKNKILSIVVKRFNYSFQRSDFEDRLIDLMIAFEALFLKEGEKGELTFKLSLRTAIFLKDKLDERQEIFNFMKKSYDIRSKIIHGVKIKDEIKINENIYTHIQLISCLEEILRDCIKKYILKYNKYPIDRLIDLIDQKTFK